jgi:hypothetical protein
MTTYLTEDLKQKLRTDIDFIDDQFELIRKAVRAGNHDQALNILDSLFGLYDFKDDFPDVPVDGERVVRFRDLYDLFAALDWASSDVLDATDPNQPGRSLARELEELRWLLLRLRRLRGLSFKAGDRAPALLDALIDYFVRLIALLEGLPDPPTEAAQRAFFEAWNQLGSLADMKKAFFELFSDPLPLAQIYLALWWLDTDMRDGLRRARGEQDLRWLEERLDCWIASKHGILAAIDATRPQVPPENPAEPPDPGWFTAPSGTPPPKPEGWDDLFPWPPPNYGYIDGKLLPRTSRRVELALFANQGDVASLDVPRPEIEPRERHGLTSLWTWLGVVVGFLLGRLW